MKMSRLLLLLAVLLVALSSCKDKEVPIETSDEAEDENNKSEVIEDIDEELEKEREKLQEYVNGDMSEVIAHHNKAIEALEKAENTELETEQYSIFVNEALPEAKKAVEAAKAMKSDANPKDLDQLEEKLVQPLHTFVTMLEYKIDALEAETKQKKKELEEKFLQGAQKYVEQVKAYYDKLKAIENKFHLDVSLNVIKRLKEHIERAIEMADFLPISDNNLKEWVAFQQAALKAMEKLVQGHSGIKDHFRDLEDLFDREEMEKIDTEELRNSINEFKEATNDRLDALEELKTGIDKGDPELIDEAKEKYKDTKQEIDELRSTLKDVKSKIEKFKKERE